MDTAALLTILAGVAVGSGGGGIIGAVVTLKRLKLEQRQSEQQGKMLLRDADVEQFRALFPAGLGDAVEHWRDEARELYKEVDRLREIERANYDEILILRTELDRTKAQLDRTKAELATTREELEQTRIALADANRRIGELEDERR